MTAPKTSHVWLEAVIEAGVSSRANHTARTLADMVRWKRQDPLFGLAWPGPARLAKRMGVSERTAKRGLEELTKAGLLQTVGCSVCDARREMRAESRRHHGQGQGHTAVREVLLPDPGKGVNHGPVIGVNEHPGKGVSEDPGKGVTGDPGTNQENNKRTRGSSGPSKLAERSRPSKLAEGSRGGSDEPSGRPSAPTNVTRALRLDPDWTCPHCGLRVSIKPAGPCPQCLDGKLSRREIAAKKATKPASKPKSADDPRACTVGGCREWPAPGTDLCGPHFYQEKQQNQCGVSGCTEQGVRDFGGRRTRCESHYGELLAGGGTEPDRDADEGLASSPEVDADVFVPPKLPDTSPDGAVECPNCMEPTMAFPCAVCSFDPNEPGRETAAGEAFEILSLEDLRAMADDDGDHHE